MVNLDAPESLKYAEIFYGSFWRAIWPFEGNNHSLLRNFYFCNRIYTSGTLYEYMVKKWMPK